jgi:thiol-disulfide isomerase/thioredoxin
MRGMKLRFYLITLLLAFFAVNVTPVLAQDESEEIEESEGKAKKKKKNKKKAKKSKSKKKAKEADEDAMDEESAEDSEEAEPEEKAKPATPKVVEALGKFKVFNSKPNLKAEYYIYLYSASWCGYCQQCMPVAVEQYKKMKTSRKVELILICGDKSEGEGKSYLKSKKLKSPAIMFSELQATQFQGLPGCGMPGYPAISVVDKEGNMIKNVVGATAVKEVLNDWRNLTIANK